MKSFLFLKKTMKVSFSLGLIFIFGAIFTLFDIPGMKYTFGEYEVSHQYWMTHGVPVFILIGCILFVISYGIKRSIKRTDQVL